MYEKMNESRYTEEETKIKHVDRKRSYQKPERNKSKKLRKVDCIRCGAPNWNKQHDCPAKTKKVPKLRKNWSLRKILPYKAENGPRDKTHSSGIGSNKRRRRRIDTKQNSPYHENKPFNKTNSQ